MTPAIELREVTKRYGEATALSGVSLSVEPGTVHCLVGPNGAGKSTLFDLVLGLTAPTDGEVRVEGTVGAAFQTPTFYPGLTVDENLRVFGDVAGGVDERWLATLRDRLELADATRRRAGDLSGGFARKLDLALAFVKRPDLAVLDEPLGDLDDLTGRRLLDFLGDYRDDGGGLLVATHRVDAFEGLADRLTVLDGGAVVFDGPTAAVDGSIERRYLDVAGAERV